MKEVLNIYYHQVVLKDLTFNNQTTTYKLDYLNAIPKDAIT